MLERAHEFSEHVHSENFEEMRKYLEECNTFYEPDEGKKLLIRPGFVREDTLLN